VAKALAVKAIDDERYVVMGPVFSGSILVSMAETKRAEIPNFTGGEASAITLQGNPYIFRTSFTQASAMPKVARYLKDNVKAKTVAVIWVNNDFGKGGRDAFMKAVEAQGIKVVADISTDQGQLDFSGAVLKAKQATRMRSSSTATRRSPRARCASCASRATTSRSSARPCSRARRSSSLRARPPTAQWRTSGSRGRAESAIRGVRGKISEGIQLQAGSQRLEGLHGDVHREGR
jgi:hypothetical protein